MNSSEGVHSKIPSLDGVRALAIMLVFFSHVGFGKIIPGGFGVTVFFFLSGYLISTLLRREFEKKNSINVRRFYLKRVLRIWPSFYLVIFFGVVLVFLGILPGGLDLYTLLSQVLHYFNFYYLFFDAKPIPGTGVYWSLAIEEHFYFIFPILFILLNKLKIEYVRQAFLFGLLCVIAVLWRLYLVVCIGVGSDRIYYASDARFDGLLFGCILAIVGNPFLDKTEYVRNRFLFFYIPLSILVLMFTFVYRNQVFRDTLRYSLQGVALFPLFIYIIKFRSGLIFNFLNSSLLCLLGRLSFVFYLTHFVVIELISSGFGEVSRWKLAALSLAGTLFLSLLMHFSIERPIEKIRLRF